jgi:hypothetical protein
VRPDQWWAADFTYVWTLAGFCYVSFVTDVYSRRILGWRVATTKATSLVLSALEQALFTRRRTGVEFTTDGLVHHSDAGSQVGTAIGVHDHVVHRWATAGGHGCCERVAHQLRGVAVAHRPADQVS